MSPVLRVEAASVRAVSLSNRGRYLYKSTRDILLELLFDDILHFFQRFSRNIPSPSSFAALLPGGQEFN